MLSNLCVSQVMFRLVRIIVGRKFTIVIFISKNILNLNRCLRCSKKVLSFTGGRSHKSLSHRGRPWNSIMA
jgi:hypothetical protein